MMWTASAWQTSETPLALKTKSYAAPCRAWHVVESGSSTKNPRYCPAQGPSCPPPPSAFWQLPLDPAVLLQAPIPPPQPPPPPPPPCPRSALVPCLLHPGLLLVAHSYYAAHPFYCRCYVHCCCCYIKCCTVVWSKCVSSSPSLSLLLLLYQLLYSCY